jgi:hypothetical protein
METQRPALNLTDRKSELHNVCDEIGKAVDDGKMGDIVAKHEKLILQYYEDVQDQAKKSFFVAVGTAGIGFGVLIFSLGYALMKGESMTWIGTASGIVIEFIAAVTFWLYGRVARQFSAFHICLERTHRYLLAYKIAEQVKQNRDGAFQELMSVMANAPMITRDDIEADRRPAAPTPRGSESLAA